MRGDSKYLACLTAVVFALVVAATPSEALTPCERQQGWQKTFDYIDTISTRCRILTAAAEAATVGFIPYPSIVAELGGGLAATILKYASFYGMNLKKIALDRHHICRIVRAGNALGVQSNPGVRRRILHYGLCPPTGEACKTRVKTEILEHYNLTNACSQT